VYSLLSWAVMVVSVGNSKSIAVGRNGVDDGRRLVIVAFVLLLGV
jgi:hypothetical protein